MEANRWLIFIIMGVILAFSYRGNNRHYKKYCVQIVTVILMCFSGFRSWQMGDVFHYCYAYIKCNTPGWKLDFTSSDTIGLQLFFRGMGSIGLSFEVCLFIIAAFAAISLGILVYKYSPSPFWSYLIYISMGFYIFTLSGLKQTIAMGFIIFAMMAIIEKKLFKFIIWIVFAALFHTPALIFIIAYIFANKKIDKTYFFVVAVMSVLIFVFRDQIVQMAAQVYYVEDMNFEAAEGVGGRVIVMALILLFGMIMRPLRNYDKIYEQVFNIMVLALLIQTFSVYDNVFTRLADYYYQFIVLYIPMIFQPGWEQAEMYPEHSKQIRCFTEGSYKIIGLCVVIFAVWYYFQYIEVSSALLERFNFFWQVDAPRSLDLLKSNITSYGGY